VAVVLGLGNPGPRYARTRHNVAWRVLDLVAERTHAAPGPEAPEYRSRRVEVGGRIVHLVQPLTFMNLSGEALLAWRAREPGEAGALLVVTDDVYLPLGRLRMRASGSSGGHRGLESVEAALGSRDWARLRIGVGSAEPGGVLRDHVLDTLDDDEERALAPAIGRAADAVECWAVEGVTAAMNRFNAKVQEEESSS
jgi:PTH1 family peptidyl-tRNA hydrolase